MGRIIWGYGVISIYYMLHNYAHIIINSMYIYIIYIIDDYMKTSFLSPSCIIVAKSEICKTFLKYKSSN